VAVNVTISGMVTYPNPLAVGSGALKVASNLCVNAPNEACSRRGLAKYGDQITLAGGDTITGITDYQDRLLVWYGDTLAYDSDGAGTWSGYSGTFEAVEEDNGLSFIKSAQSLYCNTAEGVLKLSAYNGAWSRAGAPEALDVTGALSGGSGWMANDSAAAYRVVWKRKDANDVVELGAPSGRFEITNSAGGTRDVALVITLPPEITVSDYLQIYRSLSTSAATIAPSDDLYLVKEVNPASGDITAGYMTVTDDVEEGQLGATLYTSQSEEGILQANFRPPLAAIMTTYNDTVVYANTKQPQRKLITLVGELSVDDTITIDGDTYTAKAAENIASAQFAIDSTSATQVQRIRNTIYSLVKVINRYSSNTTIYAYYSGTYGGEAGTIRLEARELDTAAFAVTQGATSDKWSPTVPTSGTTFSSDDEASPNRVYFAKVGIPGAVPILNYFEVGQTGTKIVGVQQGRRSMFVFTDDHTVYRVDGNTPDTVQVEQFDNTLQLYGPKTLVASDAKLYCYTTAGVHELNESGQAETGYPIHGDLDAYLDVASYPDFTVQAKGIAYESEHQYLLSVGNRVWCYNYLTRAWTYWPIAYTAGHKHGTEDKLYFASLDGYIYRERKTYTHYDYCDAELTVTLVSYSGYEVTVADATGVAEGDALYQTNSRWAIVTAVSGNVITVDEPLAWSLATPGTATVYKPIECELQWQPFHGGERGTMRRFSQITYIWREIAGKYKMLIGNNFAQAPQEIEIEPKFYGSAWGDGGFGDYPWGGGDSGEQENRIYVPIAYQRAMWLLIGARTETAFESFKLVGVRVEAENIGPRFVENAR
jgi:hypothetical protein